MSDINAIQAPDAALSVAPDTPNTPIVNEAEFSAAAQAAKKDGDVTTYTHRLKKPFTYEGCTVEELTFDFAQLTGNDSLAIEDELQSMNKPVIVPTLSGQYLTRVAARACTTILQDPFGKTRRVSADFLTALPIHEYNRIRTRTRSFLLASES